VGFVRSFGERVGYMLGSAIGYAEGMFLLVPVLDPRIGLAG